MYTFESLTSTSLRDAYSDPPRMDQWQDETADEDELASVPHQVSTVLRAAATLEFVALPASYHMCQRKP